MRMILVCGLLPWLCALSVGAAEQEIVLRDQLGRSWTEAASMEGWGGGIDERYYGWKGPGANVER